MAPRPGAPDAASCSAVRSTARSRTARAASRIAFAMPSRPRAAVADDGDAGAGRAGSRRRSCPGRSRAAGRRAPGAASGRRPPRRVASAPRRGRRRRPPWRVPSIVFRVTLPVKPSVTTTSASPVSRSRPSTLPTKTKPHRRPASASCASTTVGVPFFASSPTESRATRGARRRARRCAKAEPRWANWTRCWRGPRSWRRRRAAAPAGPGAPGTGKLDRERGPVDAPEPLQRERRGRHRRPGRAGADQGVGVALGDVAWRRDDRGLRARADGGERAPRRW